MIKAIMISWSLLLLLGCNSNTEKSKTPIGSPKPAAVQTPADMELQQWMKGKIWTAENENAPMSMLKLKADGGYELRSGTNPGKWQILNGNIGLDKLTDWPLEKLTDTSFRLYVKPTDKWYTYKFTGILE